MFLRQLISSVTAEIILPEITPVTLISAMVNDDIGKHSGIALMQSRNQFIQLTFGSPIGVLLAQLFMGITHTAVAVSTISICAGRKPHQIKIGIDSRCICEQIDPFGTTIFSRFITIPIKSLEHYALTFGRHTDVLRTQRGREEKQGKKKKNYFLHGLSLFIKWVQRYNKYLEYANICRKNYIFSTFFTTTV